MNVLLNISHFLHRRKLCNLLVPFVDVCPRGYFNFDTFYADDTVLLEATKIILGSKNVMFVCLSIFLVFFYFKGFHFRKN